MKKCLGLMCCTIIVPIIALLGAYIKAFGTVNIGYRLLTSAKAVRAVLSTPKEDVTAYLESYKIFETDVMTKENEKFVADYYRVLNHLCAIGDVEKMYIPPVYDLSQGVYANQWIWEEDMVEKLELGPGKHALECGCGRGRIAHHVASHSGAKVTGFNINDGQQLPQAKAYAEETGLLGTQLNFLEHSFNDKFPFEDNTFDAVYHIQALSYSADRKYTLGEIHRVLKPGGKISFLDWFLKDSFDYNNPEHVRILNRSKPILGAVYSPTIKEYIDILTELGFEIEINREASKTGHQYELIEAAKEFFMPVGDFTKFLYKIGLASKDTVDLLDRLNENVEDFIQGDKMEIFTTSWWIVAKKSEAKDEKSTKASFLEEQLSPENTLSLPSIDMQGNEEDIIQGIKEQMENLGFIQIKNVEGFDQQKTLENIKKFHSLPDDLKRKSMTKNWNPENTNRYRGLLPFVDNDESHKEFFDMGQPLSVISPEERKYPLHEETPFPTGTPELEELREFYQQEYYHRLKLGMKLCSYIAMGMGKPRDFFDDWFAKDSLATFRSIYYRPRSDTTVKHDELSEESRMLVTPDHTDSGFMTILATFEYPGLQVLQNGKFWSVKSEPNALVVNLGDTLAKLTNNKLKSTRHRVLDIGVERFSNPYFLDPKYSQIVPASLVDETPDEEPVVYGDFLIEKMKVKFAEWRDAEF